MPIKQCLVTICGNTSDNNRNKLFILLPRRPELRKKWFTAINKKYLTKTDLYCCEDHFDLKTDMKNWMEYQFLAKRVFMNENAIPRFLINSPIPESQKFVSQLSESSRQRKRDSVNRFKEETNRLARHKTDFKNETSVAPPKICQTEENLPEVAIPAADQTCRISIDTELKDVKIEDIEISEQVIDENRIFIKEELIIDADALSQMKYEDSFEESQDITEPSRFPRLADNEEGSESKGVKIEDLDISEQDIDENRIFIKEELIINADALSRIKDEEPIEESQDITEPSRFPRLADNEEGSESKDLKIEDDISDQFIDESGIYTKEECIINADADNNCSGTGKITNEANTPKQRRKIFKCQLCDYSSFRKYDLKQHSTVHSKLHPYKCHQCDFATGLKNSFVSHIGYSHSTWLRCRLCDYATIHRQDMVLHINAVHLKQLKCPMCDFVANCRSFLQKHITLVHTGSNKGDCRSSLEKHINSVHTGSKKGGRHKCILCDYAASHKHHLVNHVNSVHSKRCMVWLEHNYASKFGK